MTAPAGTAGTAGTLTAPTALTATTAPTAAPALLGISHLGLSVADLPAATDFWSGVMGFTVLTREPGLSFLLRVDVRMALGLTDHGTTVAGAFDEHHVGLDHLALAVPDLPALEAWARWLDECGVPHSPVAPSDAGHHLNLRGPDEFPVELFAMDPAVAPEFGLDPGVPPTAGTH